jgi:late competence protein required for DNA uptake (superfamily II DNA/RNA helicase)
MHAAQAGVYARLLAGDNVILSAPTSFGKSLVIDAVLASGRFDNVLIVVPTLALIDELRRRLAVRHTGHKVITHPTQPHGERNAFVLTGERVLEIAELPPIDLFVLDEFYKLADHDERGQILNQVFYDMRKQGVQYYLLGPNVQNLSVAVPGQLHDEFIRSDETTVALRFHDVKTEGSKPATLARLAAELAKMTLIYCQSPASAHRTARELLLADLAPEQPQLASAAAWVAENFHADWVLVEALRRGIGIHHGQLPRALGQFMVKAFEDGRIRWLIATGTLIEGVNTHARHVIVYDKMRPGNKKMNEFAFRNISGRCGRMFHHFSGDVWLFGKRPAEELPEVDIPILSQSEDAPTSLLQHVDEGDLSERSRERLEPFESQDVLSRATLRANVGLDLDGQIRIARLLRESPGQHHAALGFRGMPTFDQLTVVCQLLWDYLGQRALSSGYTRSPRQLARQLMNFSIQGSTKALIDEAAAGKAAADVDELVKDVCTFVRNIAGYTFPVRLRALDRIQQEVFPSTGRAPGDYSSYVARVEGLFLEPPLVALDEYGIPPELAVKIRGQLRPDGDLDRVLGRLARLDAGQLDVTPFERELIVYAQQGL